MGLKNIDKLDEKLSVLDKMIHRRHVIVHRADRAGNQLQAIDPDEVLLWVEITHEFMWKLLPQCY
jgi:uncharacterized protein (DUF2236 family)